MSRRAARIQARDEAHAHADRSAASRAGCSTARHRHNRSDISRGGTPHFTRLADLNGQVAENDYSQRIISLSEKSRHPHRFR